MKYLIKLDRRLGDQAEHGFTAANLGSAVRTNKKTIQKVLMEPEKQGCKIYPQKG